MNSASTSRTVPSTSEPARTASTSSTLRPVNAGGRSVADIEAGAGLIERLPNIDFVMSMWLPEDAPQEVVELVQLQAMLTYTRKPIVVSSARGGDAMREQVEMAAACGAPADTLGCLNMSSPSLVLDATCVEKTSSCAELGVPMVLETGVSLGSTGPVSLQTSVAVGHAEVMAALVLHQLIKPGAPFIYGTGMSQLNMSTFVDLYGGPESGLAGHLQLNLAQSLSLPTFDYAGYSDAKSHDEQAVAEIMSTTFGGAACGGTLLHDVGYLESGLLSSFEALVMGDEFAGFARASMREVPSDERGLPYRRGRRRWARGQLPRQVLDAQGDPRVVAPGAARRVERPPVAGERRAHFRRPSSHPDHGPAGGRSRAGGRCASRIRHGGSRRAGTRSDGGGLTLP